MKLNGIIGKGTGKLGSSVFAISGGSQIVREYNPVVSNPNTDAQVAQRAKLKLMSQLGAALSSGLAFRKQGLVSARNQFVSKNIGLVSFTDNEAQVTLTDLQIAPGAKSLPDIHTEQAQGGGYVVKLSSAAAPDIKRVVYVICENNVDDKTTILEVQVASEAGANRDFQVTSELSRTGMFVLAYGVEDVNSAATAKYEAYSGEAGTTEATLLVEFMRNSAGYAYTQTKGISLT